MRMLTLLALALAASPARADEAADLAAFAAQVKGEFRDIESGGTRTLTLTLSATATDADLAALAKLSPQRLDDLLLYDCEKLTDAGLLALKGMPKLNTLGLPPQLTDKAFAGIERRLPGLVYLTVEGQADPTLTSAGVRSLMALPALRTLIIRSAAGIDDGVWVALATSPSLVEFSILSCPQITGVGVKRLSECKKLTSLTLRDCPLTEAGATEIGELHKLRRLSLVKCGVTDKAVAAYKGLTDLDWISLWSNPTTDDALKSLVALPKLKRVVVSDAPISDAGLQSFAELGPLKYLDLRNTKVTEAGATAFRQARPDVNLKVKAGK